MSLPTPVAAPASFDASRTVQDLHGELAWPTIVLFVSGVSIFAAATWAGITALLPVWSVVVLNTLGLYLLFTPAHEAVHGNIKGRSKLPRGLEQVMGWISAAGFTFPYPIFSYVHRAHHKHTNHPERDPDYGVAHTHPLRVFASCVSMLLDYNVFYFSRTKAILANPRERAGFWQSVLFVLGLYALIIGWSLQTSFAEPLLFWILPALIASTFLAYIFDYLPHRPHQSRKRYLDTRILLFPGAETLFVAQNLHLIHHLYPSIPYYRYQEAFRRLKDYLTAKGATIDEFAHKKPPSQQSIVRETQGETSLDNRS